MLQDQLLKLKSAHILKALSRKSVFISAAADVVRHVPEAANLHTQPSDEAF